MVSLQMIKYSKTNAGMQKKIEKNSLYFQGIDIAMNRELNTIMFKFAALPGFLVSINTITSNNKLSKGHLC